MATLFSNVKPGEVITADLMNYVLSQLDLIDQRVTKIETGSSTGGDGTMITGFDPPNQVPAGRVLSIKGKNFAFPPTDNEVRIDDTPISVFRQDSNKLELNFIVPISIIAPPGGKNVTITVRNKQTNLSGSALYRIMPAIPVPVNAPEITKAVPADGSALIRIGEQLRILGKNFAANPAENQITFTIQPDGSPKVVYPKLGETLQIDLTQTNSTQIVLTVPDMAEVPADPPVSMTPVALQIVVGAHNPVLLMIPVNRF